MAKLSKQEFIIKAAKLYGLNNVEITALRDHLSGAMPNDFIERRNLNLYKLYDIYMSQEYNDKIDTDENGIINLNDYSFIISDRRLADSKIGRFWILSSNLEAFLSVLPPDDARSDVMNKYVNISEKNNFLLPQIAKQMGLNATVYYRGEHADEYGNITTHHLTKNFLYDEETLIQGTSILKANPQKRRISIEQMINATDRYVKNYYKKNKLPQERCDIVRKEIKEGLIKQSFFNKYVFNQNESNEKWGLIKKEDGELRLAPLYSYDYCAGVDFNNQTKRRSVEGTNEDIQSLMIVAGKYDWFRDWIKSSVLTIDFDKAVQDMVRKTGITLDPEEYEYYKFFNDKMKTAVEEVVEADFDRDTLNENRKVKLGKKIKKLRYTISDGISDIRYKFNKSKDDRDSR